MTFIPANNVISGIDPDGNEVQIAVDALGRLRLSPLVLPTVNGDEVSLLVDDDGQLLITNDFILDCLSRLKKEARKSTAHLQIITDEEIDDSEVVTDG